MRPLSIREAPQPKSKGGSSSGSENDYIVMCGGGLVSDVLVLKL